MRFPAEAICDRWFALAHMPAGRPSHSLRYGLAAAPYGAGAEDLRFMIQKRACGWRYPLPTATVPRQDQALGGAQGTPVFEPLLAHSRSRSKPTLSACPVLCAYISGKAMVPPRPLECGAT